MTDAIKDGGPAPPQSLTSEGPFGGLTVRDYFAGQATAGLLANPNYNNHVGEDARLAYELADAMIKAREGK